MALNRHSTAALSLLSGPTDPETPSGFIGSRQSVRDGNGSGAGGRAKPSCSSDNIQQRIRGRGEGETIVLVRQHPTSRWDARWAVGSPPPPSRGRPRWRRVTLALGGCHLANGQDPSLDLLPYVLQLFALALGRTIPMGLRLVCQSLPLSGWKQRSAGACRLRVERPRGATWRPGKPLPRRPRAVRHVGPRRKSHSTPAEVAPQRLLGGCYRRRCPLRRAQHIRRRNPANRSRQASSGGGAQHVRGQLRSLRRAACPLCSPWPPAAVPGGRARTLGARERRSAGLGV
jgi:hypothetical protein